MAFIIMIDARQAKRLLLCPRSMRKQSLYTNFRPKPRIR